MPSLKEVLALTDLKPPILTAYIGNETRNGSSAKTMAASGAWLKHEAKILAKNLPVGERNSFLQQLNRTEDFLTKRRPTEKGIVVLAGPAAWEMFPLQFPVKNELHWGKPSLSQFLGLLEEETSSLVVAIDRAGARFFRYEGGTATEYEESKFHIDSSQWKQKQHTHMAPRATRMPHGNQRDVFKQRMDAQYLHLCRAVAKKAAGLAKINALSSIFLVGSKRLTEPIEAALPQSLRQQARLIPEDLARVSARVLEKHISSSIAGDKQAGDLRRVEQIVEGTRGTVVGMDETLAQLQAGRIRTLILARAFDQALKQCEKCGLVDSSADPVCHACGSSRRATTLSEVLPELLRLHKSDVEAVNGTAGEKLRAVGGMGGWLRQPDKKSR